MTHRVIVAICKHIITRKALTSAHKTVCINKSANYRIIITALQIIETHFKIIIAAAVTNRIVYTQRICTTSPCRFLTKWYCAPSLTIYHHSIIVISGAVIHRYCRLFQFILWFWIYYFPIIYILASWRKKIAIQLYRFKIFKNIVRRRTRIPSNYISKSVCIQTWKTALLYTVSKNFIQKDRRHYRSFSFIF